MKLIRYGNQGSEQPGLLDADGNIRDLSDHVTDIAGETLSSESLKRLSTLDVEDLPLIDGNKRIGACVGNIGKFICIGLNYSDHAAESGMEVPEEPVIFFKATSAVCGPNDDIIKPRGSTKMDWEVELAIVIGAHVYYMDETEAAKSIAGYCVCNDLSERQFQLERSGQWVKGKSCDTFGPLGPWLVTADDLDDPDNLHMWLSVNGHKYQDGNSQTMVFKPAMIVSYLSQFMSLQSGDVISTGTPPGVGLGQNPPKYLNVGDVIELGIEGLGKQRQTVIAAE